MGADIVLPKIAILLCTFNGEKYLHEQILSIMDQTHANWRIYVSDDGSSDSTLSILRNFQEKIGIASFKLFNGSQKGSTYNFLTLLQRVDDDCEYFAFCDQDDIWHKNKLTKAILALANKKIDIPALYCGSTRYISSDRFFIQNSYIFKKQPSFKNALVQSIAGGNTMVFNRSARDILNKTKNPHLLVAHDWWTYILVTGFAGDIYYDSVPLVDYRQHTNALVGGNRSIKAKAKRIGLLLDGRYKKWTNENLKALIVIFDDLPNESKIAIKNFEQIKKRGFISRIFIFIKSGIRRQTLFGNIALVFAVAFRKF